MLEQIKKQIVGKKITNFEFFGSEFSFELEDGTVISTGGGNIDTSHIAVAKEGEETTYHEETF